MDLKELLKKKVQKLKENQLIPSDEDLVKTEEKYFLKYFKEFGKKAKNNSEIPTFFNKSPNENDVLWRQFRHESKYLLLKKKSKPLLKNDELKELWILLDQNQSFPDEQLLTYTDYQKIKSLAPLKLKNYLTTTVFAKLIQSDSQGRVSTNAVFNYVMRKVWLAQTRVGLSYFDVAGQGYLTETDLENYLKDLLPTIPQLEGLEKSFYGFYICTAVRKFLFFLDPVGLGRIKILDILTSSFLDDLLELRDDTLSKEIQEENWFSAPSALRVYVHFLNLDRDHNGMLSKSELAGYGSGTLTQPFLDRVFQTCLTYGGEMDYKTYLDLVLALENRSEPQAITFLFRILDIKEQNYLDAFTLNYFFRAIQEQMIAQSAEPVSFNDVKNELFDMVRPKNPDKITLEDLINSEQGNTFISILIEFHGFWKYENREAV